MRSAGAVASGQGLGLHDHLCWSYDDLEEFRIHARGFLAGGLELGQRVVYVGAAPEADLLAALDASPGYRRLLDRDDVAVASMSDTYRHGEVFDPFGQVGAYAAATRQALDAGFTGLRVAAEATGVVRSAAQRRSFAHYEHLIDRFMSSQPLAAMCGYDRAQLGRDAVAELACMHPVVRDGDAPFRVFAADDAVTVLAGEVEQLAGERFAGAVGHALAQLPGRRVVVDASALDFIDHHGLLTLDRLAAGSGSVVELRGAKPVVGEVLDLLGLRCVEVVR